MTNTTIPSHQEARPINVEGINTDPAAIAWTFFFALVVCGLSYFISEPLGEMLWGSQRVWFGVTTAGTFSVLIPLFLISVPEVTGHYTVNYFTGGLRVYSTGLRLIKPWERSEIGNFINLRIMTKSHVEDYPAKDGPKIKFRWSYQFHPVLDGIPYYISASSEAIDGAISDIVSSLLSQQVAKWKATTARNSKHKLETALINKLREDKSVEYRGRTGTIEEVFGIKFVSIALADADYEARFQQILASKSISQTINKMAQEFVQSRGMEYKDAVNAALIINGDVKKTVIEAEGAGARGVASYLLALTGRSE